MATSSVAAAMTLDNEETDTDVLFSQLLYDGVPAVRVKRDGDRGVT
jgi:hypothetical protein